MKGRVAAVLAVVVLLGSMVAPAAAVAGVALLISRTGSWRWWEWLIISPLLYLVWLLVFLFISSWTIHLAGRRNPKPRHAIFDRDLEYGSTQLRGLLTAGMCYRRWSILWSVPFVSLLAYFRYSDRLVLRAYSPSVHFGKGVVNMAVLYDPDLTEVGDYAVLGGRATVSAHSTVVRGDGALVYVSAPVRIGTRATLGGESRVALGCVIGDDAIVEPGAVVEAFTQIPAGEVWGGNPARFRRRREDLPASAAGDPATGRARVVPAPPTSPAPPASSDDVRRLVADALGLTPEQAEGELSSDTCPYWDSLGQVAIAAAMFDRFGVAVDGPEIFRLKTLDDIAVRVAGDRPVEAPATGEPGSPSPELPDDVELLPLLDAQRATRALASAPDGATGRGTPLRLHVVASFTAQAIEPTVRLWGRAFGLDVECRFAGYGQIVQALLEPSGRTGTGGDDVTVVLVRPEDLAPSSPASPSLLDDVVGSIERAAAERGPSARLLVGTLPPLVSSFATIDAGQAEAMRRHWRDRLAATPGVEIFHFAEVVERVGIDAARSSADEALTRGGYSQRLLQELAIAVVRQVRSARGPGAKVVALDCDNTLWGGVVGEAGLEGLVLGADGPGRSFQLFQQYLARLKDRGLLLAVVSRNEEADVRDVFARHPGMVLGADDIAAWRVNWKHKSENLRNLADELDLGLDSFVFLDDDAATRMEVKTRTPAVHVVPLPADPSGYCEALDRLWLFDGAHPTEVDATRTRKVQEERRRSDEHASAASLDEFLGRLELEVDLSDAGDDDWPRVAQLTQRTNQFNLSLKRRTPAEAKALADGSTVLVLEARDRFGDYGQIGLCLLVPGEEPESVEVDTLLMSCRALGRGIEDAFLHGIAAAAAEQGASTLDAPFVAGPRNGQIKDFLARSGFEELQPDLWRLSIDPLPPLPAHVQFRDLRASLLTATRERPIG